MRPQPQPLPVAGWREWIALPDLGVPAIKAKIDTGARTSSLHAFNIETVPSEAGTLLRFEVHPHQRRPQAIVAEALLLGYRRVRSSSGHESERPVIRTTIACFDMVWEIELTLANRDQMGFRMLLGREALRGRLLVNPGASYLDHTRRPKRPPR